MINILLWILMGALAGWLAGLIVKGDGSRGFLGNVVVGIVGALIGGFIMRGLGGSGATGFNLPSLLVSILGAVVLLVILKLIRR